MQNALKLFIPVILGRGEFYQQIKRGFTEVGGAFKLTSSGRDTMTQLGQAE